jgi:iron complex transport system substrate-binding protein
MPDVIIVMPCGYESDRAAAEFAQTKFPSGWANLPAVKHGRVFTSDANAYFSRSGPRLADGIAILARAINPKADVRCPEESLRRLSVALAQAN